MASKGPFQPKPLYDSMIPSPPDFKIVDFFNKWKKDSSQASANFTHISTADKLQKILLIS